MKPKELTYAIVLKYGDKRFTAATVTEDTGTYRQLIHKHLQGLVIEGILTKDGPFYTTVNQRALVDAITNFQKNGEAKELERGKSTFIISDEAMAELRAYVTMVARLRALRVPEIPEVRKNLIDLINSTIAELTKEKTYLTQTSITATGTIKWIGRNRSFNTPGEMAQFHYEGLELLNQHTRNSLELDTTLPWTLTEFIEVVEQAALDAQAIKAEKE